MVERRVQRAFLDLVDGVSTRRPSGEAGGGSDRAYELYREFESELGGALRALAVEPLPAGMLKQPTPRHRLRVPAVATRMLVVAVIAALAVIGVRGPFSGLPPIEPAAAAALRDAATVAASLEPRVVEDGYLYTRTEAMWQTSYADFTYLRPVSREIWLAADGSGRLSETVGEPVFLSEADKEAWIAAGSPPTHANNMDFGPDEGAFFDASTLPTDVDELRELVRSRAEQADRRPAEVEMFVVIGDFLRETVAPPEVRAALYEVAATLPGVQLLGEMTDHAGRVGIGVAMADGEFQEVLIFDPATSSLLEHQTVGLEAYGDHRPPVLWGYATCIESSIVSELPQAAPSDDR